MRPPFALYCKSYRTDLHRVTRLAQSIQAYNVDKLPFYVSVPAGDHSLFCQHLAGLPLEVIKDEAIIERNPRLSIEAMRALAGHLSQQIVKSEFWRLGLSTSYLCIDSDAIFIRPFSLLDFLCSENVPYTLIDEGQEFLSTALTTHRAHVVADFKRDAHRVQQLFDRSGRTYSFGPFPLIWHRAVWVSLEQEYLLPRNMSLMDAILQVPVESHWYGEALLKFRAIPLMPCQALFKVYHYAWQLDRDTRKGISIEKLAPIYCGVIYQSSWEREFDWPKEGGNLPSRMGRRIRRLLGRI